MNAPDHRGAALETHHWTIWIHRQRRTGGEIVVHRKLIIERIGIDARDGHAGEKFVLHGQLDLLDQRPAAPVSRLERTDAIAFAFELQPLRDKQVRTLKLQRLAAGLLPVLEHAAATGAQAHENIRRIRIERLAEHEPGFSELSARKADDPGDDFAIAAQRLMREMKGIVEARDIRSGAKSAAQADEGRSSARRCHPADILAGPEFVVVFGLRGVNSRQVRVW